MKFARWLVAATLCAGAATAQFSVPLGGTIGPLTNTSPNMWSWAEPSLGGGLIPPGGAATVTIPEDPALCGQVLTFTVFWPPNVPNPWVFTVTITCP